MIYLIIIGLLAVVAVLVAQEYRRRAFWRTHMRGQSIQFVSPSTGAVTQTARVVSSTETTLHVEGPLEPLASGDFIFATTRSGEAIFDKSTLPYSPLYALYKRWGRIRFRWGGWRYRNAHGLYGPGHPPPQPAEFVRWLRWYLGRKSE